jgi:hydroxyacylglutathione hydrolase
MILQAFVVGRLQANCYVIGDEDSREVIVVDPGDQGEALVREFEQREYRAVTVLATHHHLDHTGGVHEVLEACPDARFAIHRKDYPWIAETAPTAPSWYGHEITVPRLPDVELDDGEVLEAGRHRFTVLHTPGHTPGSLCLFGDGPDGETVVFTGDTLFRGSIGRHDFPGSDGQALLASIKRRLLTLPEETIVYPGHGDPSRIGTERDENPFLLNPRATLGFDVD